MSCIPRLAPTYREIKPVLDRYRADHPDLVTHFEGVLNQPPHALPASKAEAKPVAPES